MVFAVRSIMRNFLLLFCLFAGFCSFGQKKDSLFVNLNRDSWSLRHTVKAGEDVFALARRYHVPPAMLSDVNNIPYQQQPKPGTSLIIPVGAFNLSANPQGSDVRPLYLKANEESLQKIARTSGVSQRMVQQWNHLETNELRRGQTLIVGWLLYDNFQVTPKQSPSVPSATAKEGENDLNRSRNVHEETIIIRIPDTSAAVDTLSEGEKQFLSQTANGASTETEKGTGAFFRRAGRSENGIYFAFHNTARRGTILKIYNPGTDKTVYAKVIGKVPVNAAFHNALFGISSDAKVTLGTNSDKVWCEVSYAP